MVTWALNYTYLGSPSTSTRFLRPFLSSSWFKISCSYWERILDLLSRIICYLTIFVCASNCDLAQIILPNSSSFHFLFFSLRTLSFCWKLYIVEELGTSISCHHCLAFPMKQGSVNQNLSNMKGQLLGAYLRSISRHID